VVEGEGDGGWCKAEQEGRSQKTEYRMQALWRGGMVNEGW